MSTFNCTSSYSSLKMHKISIYLIIKFYIKLKLLLDRSLHEPLHFRNTYACIPDIATLEDSIVYIL